MNFWPRFAAAALACAFILGFVAPAHAQLMGHNTKGDFGLQSGTQPEPGFYLSGMFVRYDGDTINDRDGNSIALDPDEKGELDINAIALGFWWVSPWKILGANYGAMAFPAWANNKFQAPILGVEKKTDLGFSDLYVQPVNLGWHTSRADFTAGFGLFMPTGRYDADASDNIGMGMWSYELYAGTTLFFDEAKTWHFATTGFFEWHGEKEGADATVGNILTLEGGLGKSYLEGAVQVGVSYYAQFKLTEDDFGSTPIPPEFEPIPKHRVWGFGPELSVPIATEKTLYSILSARYFWEVGARSTVEGRTLIVTATFPIPSVGL